MKSCVYKALYGTKRRGVKAECHTVVDHGLKHNLTAIAADDKNVDTPAVKHRHGI